MLSRIDVISFKEDVETHFHIYEPRYAKMQTYAAPVIYGALTIMHERWNFMHVIAIECNITPLALSLLFPSLYV